MAGTAKGRAGTNPECPESGGIFASLRGPAAAQGRPKRNARCAAPLLAAAWQHRHQTGQITSRITEDPERHPARRAAGFKRLDLLASSSDRQALGHSSLSFHDFGRQRAVMTQA
jgi:hypothetical protein